MILRFEPGISCILQGCSDHYATSADRMQSCAAWHGFEAAMWRRTVARLRNRPWLDSLPVEVQWAHTKRVTRPSPSVPWTAGTEAMTAAASKSICPTDIIAYRANCTVFVGMHERPRVLSLSVLRCTRPLPLTYIASPPWNGLEAR